jgi:hypothetical protein
MAYVEYTSCVKAENHSGMNQYIQATIQAIAAAGIGVLLVAAAGMPWCLGIVAVIAAAMWLLGYCHWWLEDRLVCLGGDQSAVGMVVANEPPSEKSGFNALDTDFSINLLLPNTLPPASRTAAEASTPFGFLIQEQASTKNAGLPFTGNEATDQHTGATSTALHAEFEGGGVADTLLGAQIALGLATVGLILCLALGPWGAVAGYILALLALLAALLGALFGLGDTGSPADVGLPSISTNGTDGKGADILGVFGRWVYDAGHNNEKKGWNEIHPIKKAAKLGTWDGDWPSNIGEIIAGWGEKVAEASSPLTVENSNKPQHQWTIHPLIDGCDDPDDPDDGKPPVIR